MTTTTATTTGEISDIVLEGGARAGVMNHPRIGAWIGFDLGAFLNSNSCPQSPPNCVLASQFVANLCCSFPRTTRKHKESYNENVLEDDIDMNNRNRVPCMFVGEW